MSMSVRLLRCNFRRLPVVRASNQWTVFQASHRLNSSGFDDKLRQIIETSNMSLAKQRERQERQEREKKRQDELRLQQESGQESETHSSGNVHERGDGLSGVAEENETSSRGIKHSAEFYPGRQSADFNGSKIESASRSPQPDLSGSEQRSQQTHSQKGTLVGSIPQLGQQVNAKVNFWVREKLSNAQDSLQLVSSSLNELTGYSNIEKLKSLVEKIEHETDEARGAVRAAKDRYEAAIQRRSDSQKEINELLTRKHNWSPEDVERFTELYKNDHENQHNEKSCKADLQQAESNLEAVQLKLTASILTRYHEEQLWSDKIRQASTWGTWMLMGVNIVLFATATFLVEPWKRRKLVDAFQQEVQSKLETHTAQLQTISQQIAGGLSSDTKTSLSAAASAKDSRESSSNIGASASHKITFFAIRSWDVLKAQLSAFSSAALSPGSSTFILEKQDMALFSGLLLLVGCGLGSLINIAVSGR